MQTFLPYSDYVASAKCLDRQRLEKQRIETLEKGAYNEIIQS